MQTKPVQGAVIAVWVVQLPVAKCLVLAQSQIAMLLFVEFVPELSGEIMEKVILLYSQSPCLWAVTWFVWMGGLLCVGAAW